MSLSRSFISLFLLHHPFLLTTLFFSKKKLYFFLVFFHWNLSSHFSFLYLLGFPWLEINAKCLRFKIIEDYKASYNDNATRQRFEIFANRRNKRCGSATLKLMERYHISRWLRFDGAWIWAFWKCCLVWRLEGLWISEFRVWRFRECCLWQ